MTKKKKDQKQSGESVNWVSGGWITTTPTINVAASDSWSTSTWTTSSTTANITVDTDWFEQNYHDPYAELEKIRSDKEKDEALRKEHPSLQEAYEEYELIKRLVQDEECDKYFHDKMKVYKK